MATFVLLPVITNSDSFVFMELRHLRYFCAVAERRSFTLAARHLHVSQSGVSGQVKDLEREIGVRLLQRSQRDVSLTIEGEIFFREAQQILTHTERAVEMVVRASEGHYGKLAIGLCGPATAPFLPRVIRDFRKENTGVTLELKDFEPAQQPNALASGLIDIGFTRNVGPEFRKVLRSEVFFRESVLAALPKEHVLGNETTVRLAELAADPFILYSRESEPALFDAMVEFCRRQKFSPRIVGQPGSWQSLLSLVEAGEGVALVPKCVQYLRSQDVVFRPLRGRGCFVDVIIAWRRDDSNGIRDGFLNLLRKQRPEIERAMR